MIGKLDLYKVFLKVGQSESFSHAAKELYMTQPAVSQAMLQLERELDTRLFHRTSRGVTLTNEGNLLFEYVHSAINLLDTGEQKLLAFKNLSMGELKIGVGDTISRYYLLPYLEKFHKDYPNLKFKIVNATTLELCTLLKSGGIDIAVCNLPLTDPALEQIPCYEIQDIFVCGIAYKHLLDKPQPLSEIMKHPLIFLEPKSNSRKYVEQFLTAQGHHLAPEFELGSHDLLLEFAKINLGIACVTKQFALDELKEQPLYEIPLTEPIPSRHIGVCYLNTVPLSLAAARFAEGLGLSKSL